ncbi:MAG: phosphotransferase family protein [Actinobacteria bacterium]|nr:phosphotransferase family protein [Actinomycetota bacterium]
MPTTDIPGIDHDRVSDWLVTHVPGATAPFDFVLIEGGRSNLTYRVTGGDGTRYVLRRPPLGHVLATAHDMAREHRIISAVGSTGVPVPTTLGLCTDDDVNGAPFYVMSFVDGVVLDSPDLGATVPAATRVALSHHLIDVLADLHAVDVDAVGLGDLARRDGYVERQLRRWTTQWEKSKTRELPVVDEVARTLAADIPTQQGACIAHGDFRFGNCLVDVAGERVAAVLDWELCTLGDPLADLGYLGVYWAGPDGVSRPNDPTGAGGYPSHDALVERYAARTGRDVSRIDYYVAFSAFRLAVISEGVYARYVNGAMGDDIESSMLEHFRTGVEELSVSALERLRRGA